MGIDKIGPINNNQGYNKVNKKKSTDKLSSSDSVKISSEAMNKAEQMKIMEIVNNTPDIRIDKVNEMKAKINDPDYINDKIVEDAADKIMESFNI